VTNDVKGDDAGDDVRVRKVVKPRRRRSGSSLSAVVGYSSPTPPPPTNNHKRSGSPLDACGGPLLKAHTADEVARKKLLLMDRLFPESLLIGGDVERERGDGGGGGDRRIAKGRPKGGGGGDGIICPVCMQRFPTVGAIREHMSRAHKDSSSKDTRDKEKEEVLAKRDDVQVVEIMSGEGSDGSDDLVEIISP
jgi:hypothetical protein